MLNVRKASNKSSWLGAYPTSLASARRFYEMTKRFFETLISGSTLLIAILKTVVINKTDHLF